MAILIVDDKELNRRILSVILEKDYELLEASNGLEALEILKRDYSQISLIILDIVMPVMNGFKFLKKVKEDEQFRDIPIVFVTAEANQENVIKGVQGGVCDIIAKPFDPYLVHNRINHLINLTERRLQNGISQTTHASIKRPRIALIVDDMEMNRIMLKMALEKEYGILMAENGQRALELLEGNKSNIAVVLLDIIMPIMDGVTMMDVARRRGLLDIIPVIAITSEDSPVKIKRIKELGICEIIPKPFDPAVVKNRVNNMVELFTRQNNFNV